MNAVNEEKSQLKIGVVLGYINMAIGNLIPLFYTPVMLSLLGQNEYGLYKLSTTVTGYLSLVSLGIGSALTRFLIRARTEEGKDGEERMFGLFVILFRWITIICTLVGVVLVMTLHIWYGDSLSTDELTRMRIITAILVANMAMSFLQTPYVSMVTTHERFVFSQCMNILSTTAVPIANIIVLYMGYASIGMAVSTLALGVAIRWLYYLYVRKSLKITARTKESPFTLLKEIFSFSIWVFVAEVVGQLYNSTDIFLIGMIPALSVVGVAVYSIGTVFSGMVFSLTTGVSILIAPKINKMIFSGASDVEVTDFTIKVGRIQGLIFALFCSGFICFGRPFIHYYVGDEYAESYLIALLIMIPHCIPLVQNGCLNVVFAKNQHRFRSIMYFVIAVVNVVATWLILPIGGLLGAALVTGLALIVGQGLVMNWFYLKKTVIQIGRFWKEVVKVYFVPTVLCVITLFLCRYIDFYKIGNLILGILFYAVLFIAFQYAFVLNEYERGVIKRPIDKVMCKFKKEGNGK